VLDHLSGIPVGKEKKAYKIEAAAKSRGPVGSLGIWFGGCYYVRDENGNVKGRHGTYRRVACIA
jgi:hypothetical protein